jgi:membrane protein DedA with SNARE-associated domain
MNISASIVSILSLYQLPAIFIGAFFFGETVIITAAFLSAKGVWSPVNVFWLAFLGTILSDSLWFIGGRYFLTIIHRWEKYQHKYGKFIKGLEKVSGKRPFLVLLFIKFLYGTRILTIIYLSVRKISFLSFLIFDALGAILWLAVMIFMGWLVGKGTTDIIPFLNKAEYGLSFLFLIIIGFKMITLWLEKKIIKE